VLVEAKGALEAVDELGPVLALGDGAVVVGGGLERGEPPGELLAAMPGEEPAVPDVDPGQDLSIPWTSSTMTRLVLRSVISWHAW